MFGSWPVAGRSMSSSCRLRLSLSEVRAAVSWRCRWCWIDRWRRGGSTLITSDEVTRSLTGRVLTDSIDGVVTPAWTYTYDGVGRLTNAVGSGHNYLYGYAATGGCGVNTAAGSNSNRTSLVDNAVAVASYCYDNADRLTSTTQPGYTAPVVYDGHGNTTEIAGQAMTFDAADRHLGTYLPNVASPSTSVVYQRDATDRIVARTATVNTSSTLIPAFRAQASSSTPGGSGATSVSVSRPTGTVVGDVLIAVLTVDSGTTPVITAPSGWTLITDAVAGTNVRTVSWWHTAAVGDPASWTWTTAASKSMAAAVVAYSGVDTISPVVVSGVANHTTNTTLHVAPSVISTVAGGVHVAVAGVSNTTTTTPAAGLTERVDRSATSSNGVTLHIGDRIQSGTGATGTATITSAANGRGAMQTLVLRPGTLVNTTVTAHRYSYSAGGDTGDVVLDTSNLVIERSFSLPGGVIVTDRGPTGDVWSYPNIHGDTQATANSTGIKQGVTLTYDPYGNALAGVVDNQAGERVASSTSSIVHGWRPWAGPRISTDRPDPGWNPITRASIRSDPGFLCVCQAAISWPSGLAGRRRSSAIIMRQMWLASRRLRHRMASLRVLPSAIFLSK